MNRKMLAKIIPTFGEGFKEDANLDVVLSLSHDEFLKGWPDAKRSTIQIDKKGMLRLSLNMAMGINFQKENGEWERDRNIYATLEFKMLTYQGFESYGVKYGAQPKTLEMTKMKILDKDGKEQENE